MQWMVPKTRLDSDQELILDSCLKTKGNTYIRGHAGTGKTVLLIHALSEYLLRNENASVCIVLYTHSLIELVRTGIPDHLGQIPVMTYYEFMKRPRRYNLILVDEIQDLEFHPLQEIAQYSDRCIVAGDKNQSIYEDRVSTKDIKKLLDPQIHTLGVLYRLTQTIRDIVQTILPDAGIESARIDRTIADVQVSLAKADTKIEEIQWVWKQSKKYSQQGDPSVILLPHHDMIKEFIEGVCKTEGIEEPTFPLNRWQGKYDYDSINRHLSQNNLKFMYLGSRYGALRVSDNAPFVYIMTYYGAKGLDFKNVFLPFLETNVSFGRNQDLDRRVFFVGMTRSRLNLFLSHKSTNPHVYVQNMPQKLLHKINCKIETKTDTNVGFHF